MEQEWVVSPFHVVGNWETECLNTLPGSPCWEVAEPGFIPTESGCRALPFGHCAKLVFFLVMIHQQVTTAVTWSFCSTHFGVPEILWPMFVRSKCESTSRLWHPASELQTSGSIYIYLVLHDACRQMSAFVWAFKCHVMMIMRLIYAAYQMDPQSCLETGIQSKATCR